MNFAFSDVRAFVRQHRRVLLLGGLTVLLHWFMLQLIASQMGPRRAIQHEPDRVAMVTVLLPQHSAPLRVVAPPPPPTPKSTPPAPKKASRPPVIPPPVMAQIAAREQVSSEALAGSNLVQEGDAAAMDVPADKVVPEVALVPVQAAVTPAQPDLPVYKIAPPPSANLVFNVDRVDANGTRWAGESAIGWRRAADRYSVKVEIGISVLVTRVNLVVLTSEGALGDAGLSPIKMTEKRRGRSETATHFNAADKKITFSASQASFPLQPGAQDKASVPLQLAAIARGDPSQLKGEIAVQVAEDKDASVYRFIVVGPEEINTRMGRMQTVHLSRPPVPGSYSSRLDIWLSPEHDWYPVQINNLEASGAVTTETVSKITLTEPGS
jgi:hypothetical protein